jgi:transposase
MRRIREVLRLKFQLGLSASQAVNSAGIARATVQNYLRRIAATGVDHERLLALDDQALEQRLFPPRERRNPNRPLPDWPAIEQELRRRGVTLRLLWLEYLNGQAGCYQYSAPPTGSPPR